MPAHSWGGTLWEMVITRTRHGRRLSQQGVVISEVRASAGPTQSVFDVLAGLIAQFAPPGRIGVLGFAAGGMMAPLAALGWNRSLDAVDLDIGAYEIFREVCPQWIERVLWHHGDVLVWLRRQRPNFSLLLDDLSVPKEGDIFKPAVSYAELPPLIRRRLKPGGIALFNLLVSPGVTWTQSLEVVVPGYKTAHLIHFDDFENRMVIAGDALPSARVISRRLREALRRIHSRQAGRIRVESISNKSI